jgi:hypothetical protein
MSSERERRRRRSRVLVCGFDFERARLVGVVVGVVREGERRGRAAQNRGASSVVVGRPAARHRRRRRRRRRRSRPTKPAALAAHPSPSLFHTKLY